MLGLGHHVLTDAELAELAAVAERTAVGDGLGHQVLADAGLADVLGLGHQDLAEQPEVDNDGRQPECRQWCQTRCGYSFTAIRKSPRTASCRAAISASWPEPYVPRMIRCRRGWRGSWGS